MSLFLNNIPQSTDNLDFSQGQLLSNNQGLNTLFGIDHYQFTDATANKGFHNQVTTPLIVGSAAPTTVANPIFYAMQDSANVGVIQYSRGPNNAVPSPITTLQSPSTPIVIAPAGTSNVLDFTGLNRAMALLMAMDTSNLGAPNFAYLSSSIFYTAGTLAVSNFVNNNKLIAQASGNILQLKNASAGAFSNVYWTLQLYRLS